ncbi:hypothetical protein PPYR_13529 [Photinus pyralis]|uniref:AAA+ ATPase domain-containing protein n=1 Tax=Photinus pyralis TaxID=7054 RepID=A0A5N4A9E3_PHOPY|nr:cell cycle checkpoint protein RAD17 isoform X2 [Photinus pyralis]KAB0793909.1 hypothetical protein PPYR_13529 [Photinus pyralis]
MKRSNKWIAFDVDTEVAMKSKEPAAASFTNVDTPKNHLRLSNSCSSINLIEKLKPKTVDTLAVHPKKVKEVSDWLERNVIKRQARVPVLVLTGPTGAGKTATLDVVCRSLNINVREWINPVDKEVDERFYQAQSVCFLEFFSLAKYNSLCDQVGGHQVALVEDFPNFAINNPTEFVNVFERCLGHLPVVFICTDASSSKLDLLQTLFPQEMREKYRIEIISFNPISATLMKSALKRAQSFVQKKSDLFHIPTAEVIEAVVISAMGDIRCAMNQFAFACLKGVGSIPLEANTTIPKKRKRGEKTAIIKSMERDETLGFFHALGRVLNPKRDESSQLFKIQCDFESLIDQFSTQPSNFNAFLQENYLKYFGDLGDVQLASDILSSAQLFLANWNERHEIMLYSLWVGVLGLMVHNRHKLSRWNQIRGPTKLKTITNTSGENFEMGAMDHFYYNKITNSDKFHVFKLRN